MDHGLYEISVEVAMEKVQCTTIRCVIVERLTHKDMNKCMQLHLHASFQKNRTIHARIL
jgi:hypothetical protein